MARRLAAVYGFQVPTTITTRSVTASDYGLRHLARTEFIDEVRAGELSLPMVAGGAYYAWDNNAMSLLRNGTRVAVSVRPYTAIVLAELLPGLRPIWLDIAADERQRRVALRGEDRDTNPSQASDRARFDQEDAAYADVIATHLPGEVSTAERLLELYERG